MDEVRIGHGCATKNLVAILTPLKGDQKQKAAEAAFCLFKHQILFRFTSGPRREDKPQAVL
jgi:hypothetical protein